MSFTAPSIEKACEARTARKEAAPVLFFFNFLQPPAKRESSGLRKHTSGVRVMAAEAAVSPALVSQRPVESSTMTGLRHTIEAPGLAPFPPDF